MLGAMYAEGKGISMDYEEAIKWYKLAAKQGNSSAQSILGIMYSEGQGTVKDYKEAMKWYRRAAQQGEPEAQHNLGQMYALGKGVQKNFVYAHMWVNIASSNGDKNGRKLRDQLAANMTLEQFANAQELARECVQNNYRDC